jgi:membrane protein DedA with SNARE-associated domain
VAHVVLLAASAIVPIVPALVLLLDPALTREVEGLTYAGVFVVNFLLTAHVAPVPGVSALGQAVIIRQASARELPWLVGIAGGLGMGLAEVVPYFVGGLGSDVSDVYEEKLPDIVTRWAERIARPIAWMMRHFAEVTLFVLSAVPNPFYEVAGLSAGATRVHFLRFIIPTVAGKLVRGLLLAYIGARLGFL